MGEQHQLASKKCRICGHAIWPARGEGPARYSRRVVCSRRCALKLPRTASSTTARILLSEQLRTIPPGWDRWSAQRTRQWFEAVRHAARAIERGAGTKVCAQWMERLREIRA